jgi:hypothetical protein
MSKRKGSYDKLPPFIPLFRETLASPAYRQLSFAARALLTALRSHCVKNNGHVYLSLRDAGEELGHKNRNDIANWFRELERYGFIVQTEAASLGVDGKGKAPHWRITDMPTRKDNNELASATKDFLRWDGVVFEPHIRPSRRWNASKQTDLQKQKPGRHVRTTVDCTFVPRVVGTFVPAKSQSGTDVTPISEPVGGTNVTPITSIATMVARMSFPCCQLRLRDWRAEAAE